MRKRRLAFLLVLVISLNFITSATLLADDRDIVKNITLVDRQTSIEALIVNKANKSLLTKQWYTNQFEVDINQEGIAKVYSINQIEYQKALDKVSFPTDKVGDYKVYFLDYKLKNYSAALALTFLDNSTVVLGSYYNLSLEKVHQLAVHELGHQVDFKTMNAEKWQQYLRIRNLTDEKKYNNWTTSPEKRPQEIFAEDFRLLFGGKEARKIPHMNKELSDPSEVSGLKDLFLTFEQAETNELGL